MLPDLAKKDINVESIAKQALNNKKILSALLDGISSKQDIVRHNSYKIVLLVSELNPEMLYPEWDFFVERLDSDNTYSRYESVFILANLVKIDKERRFEKIFNKYFRLLNDRSVIVAASLAAVAGKIAKAKPALQPKITNQLLKLEKLVHKHKDLIKGGAIESFSQYIAETEDKEAMIDFAKNQLNCESPKTRNLAREFLAKWKKSDS